MKHDIVFDETDHSYLVDGVEVPSVTTILKPLTDRGYTKVNQSVLDYAANRGRAVHEALEIYDLGGEPNIDLEIEGYIRAYLEWESIYKPRWEGVEQIVYCDKLEYIGTLDRIGWMNGYSEFAIVDLKTSNPTKEALVSVCLQTWAYALAYKEQLNSDPSVIVDPDAEIKRYGLFLMKDGKYRVVDCKEYEEKYGLISKALFIKLLGVHQMITETLATKARKGRGE